MAAIFGGGTKTQAQQQPAVAGLQIQTSAYGKVIPVVYGTTRLAPNLIWYGDFQAIAHQSNPSVGGGKGGSGGGGGKGGGGGPVSYTYQASVALGLCEGPIGGIGAAWASKTETSLAALGLGLMSGAFSQAAWSYLSSAHPDQALGYSGTAYVAGAAYQLDDNGQLPNHNFEVQGFLAGTAPGGIDADPSRVVADLLINAFCGAGFPAARLADLSTYQAYVLAAGLWISPAYAEEQAAAQMLDDIATYTNSAFVWSSGVLRLVPYGDATLNGNGYSYAPPSAPLYDLDDDDFLDNAAAGSAAASRDPLLVTRKRPADALNDLKLEFLDRAKQYNTSVVEASDQAMIDLYGLRGAQVRKAHLFADLNAARQSVQLLLQHQAIRNTYQFTLDQRYILLDPMDIVTVSDARLGLDRQWVRITEITENDDGSLAVTAEDYLAGTGSAATYSFATGIGYAADYNSDPGDANVPVLFEPPPEITDTGLEIWLAISGGANWGGCNVYVSSDGNTYRLIGQKRGPSRQGVLTAPLPSGGDPDLVNSCSVDLSESFGQLLAGTQADADALHTLCWISGDQDSAGELIAYEQATLTGSFQYDLGTNAGAPGYLRRGAYATRIASHPAGAAFARLDSGIFTVPYSRDQIGRTLYIKLASFNLWGGGLRSLAEVSAIAYAIQGPPPPPDVSGFIAQQNGNVVVFAWDAITTTGPTIKGYDIGYAPQGTAEWSAFRLLTEASAGTEMTNADVPRGSWTFGIRARDLAGQLSPDIATADLVVTSTQPVIYSGDEAPGWSALTE
jgi:Putative phage tail protein